MLMDAIDADHGHKIAAQCVGFGDLFVFVLASYKQAINPQHVNMCATFYVVARLTFFCISALMLVCSSASVLCRSFASCSSSCALES